ncbi:E3 ubiquitin-protein ligase TRIM45-like [Saccostrea cucullata]|uniref:E3 ubiquitin-protein ligase TRIM45-like n=1 Tax=Saccostrea cuccullata TaxID=36930 RepID=UPI002ED47D46
MATTTSSAQHFIECEHCEENPSKFLCKTCSGHMCEMCKTDHEMRKFTRHHEKTELTSDKEYTTERPHCFLHITKKLECYCSSCQKPICTQCLIETHNGHKVENLEETYEKIRRDLQMEKEEIETVLMPKYRDLLSKEEAKTSDVSKRADQGRKQIEDHTEKLKTRFLMFQEESVEDYRPGDVDQILSEKQFGDSPNFHSKEDIKEMKRKRQETPVMCCEEYPEIEDFHRSLFLEGEDKD